MATSTKRWLNSGLSRLCLVLPYALVQLLIQPTASTATEMWNALEGATKASSEASAIALEGIIAGLEAFRRAESEGPEARKKQLESAASKLDEAQGSMAKALEVLSKEPSAQQQIPYALLSEAEQQALDRWLSGVGLQRPETFLDVYKSAVDSTAHLANKYRDLAKRDDAVLGEFVPATFDYLQAGSVASKLFKLNK